MAKRPIFHKTLYAVFGSVAGAVLAIVLSGAFTLLLSLMICLGLHPESTKAEWATVVVALVWSGALVRRSGAGASVGSGIIIGLLWAAAWLWLVSRWDARFLPDVRTEIAFGHILSWLAAPVLTALGGFLSLKLTRRWLIHPAAIAAVILAAVLASATVEQPRTYRLADGATLEVMPAEADGTTARLFTFDFRASPKLRPGICDRDSDDARPFDDLNTSYFATPATTVLDRLGPRTLAVANAGFFTWTPRARVASHVAPVVSGHRVHYNIAGSSGYWIFGWDYVGGRPRFSLTRGLSYKALPAAFDSALVHVRPLIIDGDAPVLKPGAGVTRLKCSRTSVAWSADSSKLYLLVVRDPDGERASINAWRAKVPQVGGWDLPRVQSFWKSREVSAAVALDGGDSTQATYRGPGGVEQISSGRLGFTSGYLRNRPIRTWLPVLPIRNSGAGVINYFYVRDGG